MRNRKEKILISIPMKDYYLQNIIDHFWEEDKCEDALYRSFEFILGEYQLKHIDIYEFNLLFNFIIYVKNFYDYKKDEK